MFYFSTRFIQWLSLIFPVLYSCFSQNIIHIQLITPQLGPDTYGNKDLSDIFSET